MYKSRSTIPPIRGKEQLPLRGEGEVRSEAKGRGPSAWGGESVRFLTDAVGKTFLRGMGEGKSLEELRGKKRILEKASIGGKIGEALVNPCGGTYYHRGDPGGGSRSD